MKHEVTAKLIEIYRLEVEAETEEDAINLADELLEGDLKHKYHEDSDAEFTAYEV